MDLIHRYFPQLEATASGKLAQLDPLYHDWNARINVVSRKDIDNLYLHHILHALAIARVVSFVPGSEVLDLGTGGGLPGIPLAILFPDTKFTLADSIRKKITVVENIAEALELSNVTPLVSRVEALKGRRFDFVVSRAVAPLDQLVQWAFPLIRNDQRHALPNGLLALKGGNIQAEIKALPRGSYTEVYPITDFFDQPYFEEKYVVYVQY